MMVRKTWLLAAALLLAAACGDDDGDSSQETSDAGPNAATAADAALPDGATPDAGGDIDSGFGNDAGDLDASVPGSDAALPDAAPAADAATAVDAATLDAARQAQLAVIGHWHTQFAYTEIITATEWTGTTIVEYDNDTRVAYVQNSSTPEMPIPGFSKYTWTEIQSGGFHYCTVEYGLPTLAAAKTSTKTVDASDLAGGCNGFEWTHMGPVIEIEGQYKAANDDNVAITSDKLGANTIESYDNPNQTAVVGVSGEGDAGVQSYNKLVWATPEAKKVYLCFVAEGFDSAEQAAASTATADSTQLETGCNGQAWSLLNKQ